METVAHYCKETACVQKHCTHMRVKRRQMRIKGNIGKYRNVKRGVQSAPF